VSQFKRLIPARKPTGRRRSGKVATGRGGGVAKEEIRFRERCRKLGGLVFYRPAREGDGDSCDAGRERAARGRAEK